MEWWAQGKNVEVEGEVGVTPVQGVTRKRQGMTQQQVAISIHTPVQGVTLPVAIAGLAAGISIHTPVQGVTMLDEFHSLLTQISIHTLVQGVTKKFYHYINQSSDFNPHSCTRSDQMQSGY